MTFRSLIRGTPPFKVSWFKGSRELVPGKTCNTTLADSTAELELFEVGPLQTGEYTCLATNDAGSATCTTQLFVKGLSECYFSYLLAYAQVNIGVRDCKCARTHRRMVQIRI